MMTTKPATSSFQESANVANMQASSTLAAMQAADALRSEGVTVFDFGAGEPDFDTPDNIKRAAEEAMRAGKTKYTPTAGTRLVQKSIIDFYAREFGTAYERNEVMTTSGGKQAIFNAVVSLINPGDEVLIAKPYWVTFPEVVAFAGGTPVYIETEETGFVLSAEQVERAITPRTKLIILNSPSNPSGRVIPPEEFQRIMELLSDRGIYVISDECYLRFVYPPAGVFSAASLPGELRSRLCIAGSFSKTYAMTGWRIGYALAPAGVDQSHAESARTFDEQCKLDCPERSGGSPEWTTGLRRSNVEGIHSAARLVTVGAKRNSGVICNEPEGAFYAFPSIKAYLGDGMKTSGDFAQRLIDEEQTVVTDGAGFGAEGYLRISYATSMSQLQEGIERIKRFVERLNQSRTPDRKVVRRTQIKGAD